MRKCETIVDNKSHVVQIVTLGSAIEARNFVDDSRRYGAIATHKNNVVKVLYKKNENGKIGLTS